MPMFCCKEDINDRIEAKNKKEAIEKMDCIECIFIDCTGPVYVAKYKEDVRHG